MRMYVRAYMYACMNVCMQFDSKASRCCVQQLAYLVIMILTLDTVELFDIALVFVVGSVGAMSLISFN